MLLPAPSSGIASSYSEAGAALFDQGNSEYRSGNFESAERYYRRILEAGVESGSLYYNLGNACFKQKKLGEAIYFWEKARRFMPSDRDVRENLELANLMIVDRIDTRTSPLPLRIVSAFPGLLTITQESRLVLAIFASANLLFAVWLVTRNRRNSFGVLVASLAAGLVFLLFASSLAWKVYEATYRKQGIVIEQKVDVRSGPGLENMTVFTIHEGIAVRVHKSANGWYQISLPNGWNGWLPQTFVRLL